MSAQTLRRTGISIATACALAFSLLMGITSVSTASEPVASERTLTPAATTRTLEFVSTVASEGTTLNTLPGGITYGWNHLTGKTRWGKRHATIEFLGDVDYKKGSGPFNGFITVTRSDGTKIAFVVVGWTSTPAGADTADATFTGTLNVIGGSKNYRGVKGTGIMTGSRKASLGGEVNLRFALAIER
jgi:hypothetical protein